MRLLPFLLIFLLASSLFSQEKKEKPAKPIKPLKSFITLHQGQFGGKTIKYKAIAKEVFLKNDLLEPIASIWSVAYLKEGEIDPRKRPVTFIFNGGPGSASVWLHMGVFGPKLVQVDSEAKKDDGAAPYALVDNEYGLLDLTDLVFIDPVGTGYSQLVGKGKAEDFWGLSQDAASIAKFMRTWVTENNRWLSPKYIAGESFGTTRAVQVAKELEGGGQNMALNGLILISQALDYAGSTPTHGNITSYLTYLPTMAATAWYHKKAGQGKELEAFVQESRTFTYDEYAPALYRGALLSEEKRNQIAEKLSYFTGLDKSYILQSNLRILRPRFQKKLLEEKGLTIGALDSRFMGDEIDDVADSPHLGDAASYQIGAAYTAALNHYFSSTLEVNMGRPYLTSNRKVGSKWIWKPVAKDKSWEPSYVNTAPALGEVMRRNTDLRVLVASGYYDMVTPFFDAEYTFARHGMVQERVKLTYYKGGHMMYIHQPDLIKLTKDIRLFLTE